MCEKVNIVCKIVKDKIKLFSKNRFDNSVGNTVATINTTLIAVLFACLSAYVVYTQSTIQNSELKAIDEAGKINNLVFEVHFSPYRILDSNEILEKDKLIDMMQNLIFGNKNDLSLPVNIQSRANKALGVMSALVGQYPFPGEILVHTDGRYKGRNYDKPVVFSDLDEVRTWIIFMRKITNNFTAESMGIAGNLLPLFENFAKGEQVKTMNKTVSNSPLLSKMAKREVIPCQGYHITLNGLDPLLVYQDFLKGIGVASKIINSTSIHIKRVEAFQRGYASKSMLILVFSFTFIAFCFGVIYPLVTNNAYQIYALWLPLSI